MTDPRAALEAYGGETAMKVGAIPVFRGEQAPKAFAALGFVLDLHHDRAVWDGTRMVASGTCNECSEREDTYDDIPWPCLTVRAITTALEAS